MNDRDAISSEALLDHVIGHRLGDGNDACSAA